MNASDLQSTAAERDRSVEPGQVLPIEAGAMRAVLYEDYGDADVLHLGTRPVPKRSDDQLLIQVKASSVNPIDVRLRRGEMKHLLPGGFPRTPGFDVAGEVVDCPRGAPLKLGDRVLAFLDQLRGGALADYAVCSVAVAAKLPPEMPYDVAAAIPLAGTTAVQSLRDHGRMRPGQRVLVNGASGGVGMFALQIAHADQCHVTAVASGPNEAFCREMGADEFIDYRSQDFTALGQQWDLIFDVAGKSNYWDARNALTPAGRFVSTEPNFSGMATSLLTWPLAKSGRVMLAKPSAGDLEELLAMHREGRLEVVLDRTYPIHQAADAHRRVETGVDHGKVVVLHS